MEIKYLTPQETADYLNRTKETVSIYRRKGMLKGVSLTRFSVYYSIEEVERLRILLESKGGKHAKFAHHKRGRYLSKKKSSDNI